MDCNTWKRKVRYMATPLSQVRIEWYVEHHFCIVTLRSIVRLASWVVDDMRREGLAVGTVIIVGSRLDWGVLHAVALRVVNRLYTSSWNCWDAGEFWMVGSYQRAVILLAVIWYSMKDRPCIVMVEE